MVGSCCKHVGFALGSCSEEKNNGQKSFSGKREARASRPAPGRAGPGERARVCVVRSRGHMARRMGDKRKPEEEKRKKTGLLLCVTGADGSNFRPNLPGTRCLSAPP